LPALAPYSDRLFPAVAIAFPIRPVLKSKTERSWTIDPADPDTDIY
jgi:hypothetical protein